MRISAKASQWFAVGALLTGVVVASESHAMIDCCFEHAAPFCGPASCALDVCSVDPFCCAVSWDALCADEAEYLCGNLCPTIDAGPLPIPPDVVPDPDDPGTGGFPNGMTRPLTDGELLVTPWGLHVGRDVRNVAGIIFRVHYDSNELDLIHTWPGSLIHLTTTPSVTTFSTLLANATPFGAPSVMSIFPGSWVSPSILLPFSSSWPPLTPSVTGSYSNFRTHVGWMTPFFAFGSGFTLFESSTYTFASFSILARHTTLTNGDADLSVPSIWLIRHASMTLPNTTNPSAGPFSVWFPGFTTFSPGFFTPASTVMSSSFYVPLPVTTTTTTVTNTLPFSAVPEIGFAAHLGLEHQGPQPTPTPTATPLPSECIWEVALLEGGACGLCNAMIGDECTSDALCGHTCARPLPKACGPDCLVSFKGFVCRPPTGEPSCSGLPASTAFGKWPNWWVVPAGCATP